MKVKIAPSIIAADLTRLGEQVGEAISAAAEYIHLDVMDGHFVPNMTFGPLVAAAVKPLTAAAGVILDVHLMVEKPEKLIPEFESLLTLLAETSSDPYIARYRNSIAFYAREVERSWE